MRRSVIICLVGVLCSGAFPQDRKSSPELPSKFQIGRHTFMDIGPPFDFYELFTVRSAPSGTSIEKITLTPAGIECVSPAKIKVASVSITESISSVLESKNPCTIPEKQLRRELKRRKKGLVFSGADVVMQVQCGNQTRLIRADILDRDMFDSAPNTPQHTSWTMRLLSTLDRHFGPGVLDKPIFPGLQEEEASPQAPDSAALRDLIAGKYDALFPDAPHKFTDLYQAAQNPPPPPSVRLLNSGSIAPQLIPLPEYPPLARMVAVEGTVAVRGEIDANGAATNLTFESGHPLLREAVKKAARGWKFPIEVSKQQICLTFEFALNCHAKTQ